MKSMMKAMELHKTGQVTADSTPLSPGELDIPRPEAHEVLIRVSTCGVCHTELDEIEGRTPPPVLPVVPGHQVVGTIVEAGAGSGWQTGTRVGVAWIYSACGQCRFCASGQENLCHDFRATGRDVNGGYAQYMVAPAAFVVTIPEAFTDEEAAPLLCAGAIGYRSLMLTGIHNGDRLGLTGFGGSGHQVLQLVRHCMPATDVYVFARSAGERAFARQLGAVWAGDTQERAPQKLHAIIDTTPVWQPVLEALANLERGARLVINAIRKEDSDKNVWQQLSYEEHLWYEREIKSVANVTRADVQGFLEAAARFDLKPAYETVALEDANEALKALKQGNLRGAKVLKVS